MSEIVYETYPVAAIGAHPSSEVSVLYGWNRMSSVSFPHIISIGLRRISLFPNRPTLPLSVDKDVFCLAGANGIGKSTTLVAVSYGLTGIVVEPGRKFTSVDEYYRDCLRFSKQYFGGRIQEKDRDEAEVELKFELGANRYTIVRGLFEPQELRTLRVVSSDGVVLLDGTDHSPEERNTVYMEKVAAEIGVKKFQQYSFLHHFVFTFDERHFLLFWDQEVLEQALYLAFGLDFEAAQQADQLRREAEKADSRARNASWQASEIRKKINDLEKRRNEIGRARPDSSVLEDYRQRSQFRDAAMAEVDRLERECSDAELSYARAAARMADLRREFTEAFTRRTTDRHSWNSHPIFILSRSNKGCELCGDQSAGVLERIAKAATAAECPICGSGRVEPEDGSADQALSKIDADLADHQLVLQEASERLGRVQAESRSASDELVAANLALSELEGEHPEIVAQREATVADSSRELDAILSSYERQRADLLEQKTQQRKRRDKAKKRRNELKQDLEAQYAAVRETFVPSFRELANLFLGMDLDVDLQSRSSGVQLVLEVRGQARRQHFSLSESQKYFVDIALRMAIAEHMSRDGSPATLLVDTPEGSLDIAYEARAGDMFARFAERGNRLIMTANVNSSRLLIRLAERCGHDQMQFVRMMEWAELSDVQQDEEGLFDAAYKDIESAFNRGDQAGG